MEAINDSDQPTMLCSNRHMFIFQEELTKTAFPSLLSGLQVFFIAMVTVDFHSVAQPVGILRTIAMVLTCLTFTLVATVGHNSSPYGAWCMFTWGFCFFFTLLILILEFTKLSSKLPLAWDDFTAAFPMLAGLMCFSSSIIYPIFFTCASCTRQISASVVSWICFGVYTAEAVWTRLRPRGETIGFLSTIAGILKLLEAFFACLIFTSLEISQYHSPGLQWCVAVYSLCFTFTVLIILLTVGQITLIFPFSFDKFVVVHNILAAAMYVTAVVIWPLYSFGNSTRPSDCGSLCSWDKLVVVSFMSMVNCIVYILDSAYSVWMVLFCMNQ